MSSHAVQVKLAWWFNWLYMYPLLAFCFLFDRELDMDKVGYWMNRAIVIKQCESKENAMNNKGLVLGELIITLGIVCLIVFAGGMGG